VDRPEEFIVSSPSASVPPAHRAPRARYSRPIRVVFTYTEDTNGSWEKIVSTLEDTIRKQRSAKQHLEEARHPKLG